MSQKASQKISFYVSYFIHLGEMLFLNKKVVQSETNKNVLNYRAVSVTEVQKWFCVFKNYFALKYFNLFLLSNLRTSHLREATLPDYIS